MSRPTPCGPRLPGRVKLCLFIGLALLAIQSVSEILKQVQAIVELAQGRKRLPADGKEAQ